MYSDKFVYAPWALAGLGIATVSFGLLCMNPIDVAAAEGSGPSEGADRATSSAATSESSAKTADRPSTPTSKHTTGQPSTQRPSSTPKHQGDEKSVAETTKKKATQSISKTSTPKRAKDAAVDDRESTSNTIASTVVTVKNQLVSVASEHISQASGRRAGVGPSAPARMIGEVGLMGWARRSSDATPDEPATTAAVTNSPPESTGPTQGAPNTTTGAVSGNLNVTDPDGDAVTYSVTSAPKVGGVTVNSNGGFVYTPRQSARLNAGASLPSDSDAFVVTASDGENGTPVAVTVPIYSAQLAAESTTTATGASPTAIATYGDRVYVANTQGNSVTTIDATTNAPVATVAVGAAPTALAVSPNGSRLYVVNRGGNTVSAVNTTTGATIATASVGASPQGIAINPSGTRAYVTNANSNTVSVVDTATMSSSATISVGTSPVAAAASSDGTRLYVANRGSNSVSVVDTATNQVIKTLSVGSTPTDLALNSAGTRLYVANYGSSDVTVIDPTKDQPLATVALGHRPSGLAVSRDRSLVYVVNSDSTLSVVDTVALKKVTGTLRIESGPGSMVALSPDGNTVYVTNSTGSTLRAASFVHAVDPPPVNSDASSGAWVDHFTGADGTKANSGNWNYVLGAGGATGELNAYTDYVRNASLDGDGHLVITAIEEPIEVPGYGTFDYSSAFLTTEDKFEFTYGTVRARIKFPAEQGLLPAFWMLGSDVETVGWPRGGEIDIMEVANDGTVAGSSIHGPGGYVVSTGTSMDLTDDFHEYWVRWEPNKITTGIDNTTLAVFTPDSLPPGAPWTFNDRSMYMILNISVGSPFGQPDETTQLPADMVVDWVRYRPLTNT